MLCFAGIQDTYNVNLAARRRILVARMAYTFNEPLKLRGKKVCGCKDNNFYHTCHKPGPPTLMGMADTAAHINQS